MHITRTNPKATETKLVIKAEPHELLKAKELTLKKLAPQIKAAGFRTGKVPLAIVEKNVDPNVLQSEVLEETINKLYASAIRQEELRPVANPEVTISKFVPYDNLEFTMTVPTLGKIKLADYKKIKLPKKPVKVTADDVNNIVKSLQLRSAERKSVERAAKDGDEVIIDFKGTSSKGEPVQGADSVDFPLLLGSKSFIPGFEDNLIGLNSGENKTFTLTFPKDYSVSALKNKKVTFEVSLKTVNEMILPKVDDQFAASVGPFKDMIELRADIKKQVEIERSKESEAEYENQLLQKITEQSIVEIPDSLIDEQVDRIEEEEKQNLLYRGVTFEEHLKEEGVNPEEHKLQKRPVAEQRIKTGIVLTEIAEKEAIEASPEETEARLQIMRAQYKDPAAQAELSKPEALRDVYGRLVTEKTVQKIKEYASSK